MIIMSRKVDINEEILFAPLRKLGRLLKTRKLTSRALTDAYLERLEKFVPKLGAVVTITRERALEEAKAADEELQAGKYRGPLHGIPYGVKDLLATKGSPTSWGAEPFKDQVFDFDATVVKKLREAGGVLVAKLAMVELAGGFGYNNADASFTGPGRTPWNTDFWSGGSSSGPGAATAAGLVGFAIGSETSGSIITPAAFCGVSGLRPTYGRVSRHGAMALSWTLDKLGPMCRTADDCALVLAAISGKDSNDSSSVAKSFHDAKTNRRAKKFKIGVIKGVLDRIQPEVKSNFEESLKTLAPFANIEEEVPFPAFPFGDVIRLIIDAEAASAFRDFIDSGWAKELRAINDRYGGYASTVVLAVDYLQALRVRRFMKKAMDALYSKYDALAAPARATVAFPIGVDFDKAYPGMGGGPPVIPAGNIVGQPAISVFNGFGKNQLPTGIQFTGHIWSESRLLEIANRYQEVTDWHQKRPPIQ